MQINTYQNIYTLEEIRNFLKICNDSNDIYENLIELGKLLTSIDDKYKIESNKVYGCQSNVWVVLENNYIYVDSNSAIVKGLLHIVLSIIFSPQFIENIDQSYDFIMNTIKSFDLMEQLSTFRKTGLNATIQKISLLFKDNKN